MSINASASIPASTATGGNIAATNKINPLLETGKGKGEDHFSFWDVLDVINPLQHIPIVNNIYRAVTGDQISNVARVAGDALYGGVIGAAFGLANAVSVHMAGDDMTGVALNKMGLVKSQEAAQAEKENGIPSHSPYDKNNPGNAPTNMPVVEVHPSRQASANYHHGMPDKNGITWDQDVSLATVKPDDRIAAIDDPAATSMPPKNAEVEPVIAQADQVMPQAKKIADIPPVDGTIDPSVSKADVQKNMMDALNKYNAMQNSAPAATGAITDPAALASASSAPKNIFATPAGAPVGATADASQDDTVPQPKRTTAAFNKLRHYSS